MNITNITALLAQGKLISIDDIDPNEVYVEVGVFQHGNSRLNSANPNAYAPYLIKLSDLGCVECTVNFQTDLQSWYNKLTVKPSAALMEALNTLMLCLEFQTDLAKCDLFHVIGGMETDEQRLTPIKSTSGLDFTPVNTPILNNMGMTSGAGYLDLNWNPTLHGVQYTASSSSFGVYKDGNVVDVLLSSSGTMDPGPYTTSGLHYIHAFNQVFAGMRTTPFIPFATISSFKTVMVVKRNGGFISLDTGGVANLPAVADPINGLTNKNMYLGTANGMGENGDGKTLQMVVAGSGNLSTAPFFACVQQFMTTRGVSVNP